ncbi:MAG: hypothetical protein ACRCWD_07060, partial [Culicoidibacterales bacterium]
KRRGLIMEIQFFIFGAAITASLWIVAYIFIFERTLKKQQQKIMVLRNKNRRLQQKINVLDPLGEGYTNT